VIAEEPRKSEKIKWVKTNGDLQVLEAVVGAFERGNSQGAGSGSALVREMPLPVGSVPSIM
jgi:hypothetical protein